MMVGSGSRSAASDVRASTSAFPRIAASWMRTPAPICTPSWITTFAPICTSAARAMPSPSQSPGPRSDGWSTRGPVERFLQTLEHAHDAQTASPVRDRRRSVAHALGEVLALDPQRLLVRDARAPDVARARDVLAVRAVVLVEALVVHGDLALELHVVERGHPPRPDHGEAALLVRVEP